MNSSTTMTLLQDWQAESENLLEILDELNDEQWEMPTPAPGWTVKHQVAHLDWTERMLLLSVKDTQEFNRVRKGVMVSPDEAVDRAAKANAHQSGRELTMAWMETRKSLYEQLWLLEHGQRIAWFGPSMGVATALSARIMEIFAHGQDIRDALGIAPSASDRLRHIAHLAIAARDFSFTANSVSIPEEEFRIELEYLGQIWTWGPEQSAERVIGLALDFGMLATRRRHRDDCAVKAYGEQSNRWLDIIQAYAGSPGQGRAPLDSRKVTS